jgi:hypothetical protein
LALMACSKADVSGTYVASDPNMAMMLQLEETPDNRISGQLAFLTIDSNGHIESKTAAVSGAADGSAITLTVQPVPSLPIGTNLSGSQNSQRQLTLNGPAKDGQVPTWTLEPSTFFVFQTLAGRLRARSVDILKAKDGQPENARRP